MSFNLPGGGLIFVATASQTIANTTSETTALGTGVGSKTLPANFFSAAGKAIRLSGGGIYGTTAVPGSLVVKIKLGSTVIATSTLAALLGSVTNVGFNFSALIVCRTTGASGTVATDGHLDYAVTGTGRQFADLNNAGATSTIDTTASLALDVTVAWATASASNTLTTAVAIINSLN